MFEQATATDWRNVYVDWALRAGIALAFVIFGLEKFPSSPESMWPEMFRQIGVGQWFRYFTGAVEVLGGVLVLVPRTVSWGLAVLCCTMAGAALLWIFVLGQAGNSVIPFAFLIGLAGFRISRRGDA